MMIIMLLLLFGLNIMASENYRIIELDPERYSEFRDLRIQAVNECPQAIGGSIESEMQRPFDFYKNLLELALKGEDEWFVFAQEGNKLIGMAGAICKMKHISECRHMVTIVSVYVDPCKRKLGVGTKLLEALIKKLKSSERVSEAMLYVTSTEKPAIELYRKVGFEICGELHNALIINGILYNQKLMQRSIEKNKQSIRNDYSLNK